MFFVCSTCGYSSFKELSVQYPLKDIKNICKNVNTDEKDYVENNERTRVYHMKYCHVIMMLPPIVKIVKG